MALTVDMAGSARRHFAAACRLDDDPEHARKRDLAVAGYLFGIAGECALKQLMRENDIRPTGVKTDDPFYAHFPELRSMLRDLLSGRKGLALLALVRDDSLMNEWNIRIRYAAGRDVSERLVKRWREHAQRLVDAIEG